MAVGSYITKKVRQKMTGRLLAVQYQNLYLARIGLEVRLKKNNA